LDAESFDAVAEKPLGPLPCSGHLAGAAHASPLAMQANLLSTGHFTPATVPSQATAATWHVSWATRAPPHRQARCGDHECKHPSHSTRGVHRVHHGVYPLMEEETLNVVSSSQAAPLVAADGPGHCPTSSLSHHCPRRAGVPTSIALASSPCMRRRRCLPRTGDLAPVARGYL
jgi:hypothetical protein